MDLKYCDTIYVVRNLLTKEQCKSFINEYEVNKQFSRQEQSTNYITNTVQKNECRVISIYPQSQNFKLIHNISEKFIGEWIEYLSSFNSFFVQTLKKNLRYSHDYRIIKYETGEYAHPHIDWSHFIHASMTFNLNDEYDGGEFSFFNGKYSIKLGTGDAIIFPSDPFWVHEIKPILSGNRYSVNAFICSLPDKIRKDVTDIARILATSPKVINPWYFISSEKEN